MRTELERILQLDMFLVYGAGNMGKAFLHCMTGAPFHRRIKSFLVKDKTINPVELEGIPVRSLEEMQRYRKDTIIVALHENNLAGAFKDLREAGFKDLIAVSFESDLWCELRRRYFRLTYLDTGIAPLHVYVVHSAADRLLRDREEYASYEIPIQAGAALTPKRICDMTDDVGENISAKNARYCELTALYWIWKHDRASYVGLSHYRRRFVLDPDTMIALIKRDVDIAVTVPVLNVETVRGQYAIDHDAMDFEQLLTVIGELAPDYGAAAERVANRTWYYAYNMLIAKREVLDSYCTWLFPILQSCEERIGEKETPYQNRYIGFLAERLMTIFLEQHREDYHMAILEKHFMGGK